MTGAVTDGAGGSARSVSYRDAGVDVEAGDRAVQLMRQHVARATRPEVVGSLGGFAGLFALDVARYRRPLLASSTDGVGTKIAVARAMDTHDTVGIDLVAMVVDDLVVCGAEPLFLLDYIACGSLEPGRIASIVSGIASGCEQAGCALVGGETAEHPGLMGSDDYDLAATGVGVVEADAVLGPELVRQGDVVVAMASSGLHSNGFSLVRHILFGPVEPGQPGGVSVAGRALLAGYEEALGGTVGQALLAPTRIYARDCLAVNAAAEVHAFAHITGGGLAANLARVIPPGAVATVERSTWRPPAVFGFLAERGGVSEADMEATFNQGVGMVAVVAADDAAAVVRLLTDRGVAAWIAGGIEAQPDGGKPQSGSARLVGAYR
ncbi:phosphoribosylformylglycinamidine cyclo-ligase [Parafrankia colletiae]|uniref:Phosphoribosylformylglycinamidine cyclo-ligase n=1 Tax=Parafrankia colletiae TaxID=573497 RepID=A0A1S1Q7T1_9ACTN|nr:phosphoribosylformylglycinamidine cyclo-ligase [Parafrankia colletiae]MCK9903377.1 phosphoribosylformylglycinamidine cyclo-ligase [Frankia sp. Cpl3]OHV30000.1 phosphoribosylformylglycinamidine cyclo-ligase [Parafrankia colletiae]